MNMPLNLQDVEKFIHFFSADPSTLFCWAYFNDSNGIIVSGCSCIYGTKEVLLKEIESLCLNTKDGKAVGITAHLLVNKSSFGRRTEHIEGTRVLFADIDRFINNKELARLVTLYKPHLVVRSSLDSSVELGKYHFYWKVKNVSLPRWQVYQRGIAGLLGGDTSSAQVTKLMRVPGISRTMKTGTKYVPEIIELHENASPLDILSIRKQFPSLVSTAIETKKQERRERQQLYRNIGISLGIPTGTSKDSKDTNNSEDSSDREIGKAIDVKNFSLPKDISISIGAGKRNDSLYFIAKELVVTHKLTTFRDLYRVMGEINKGIDTVSGGPLSILELASVVKSAWKRGKMRVKKITQKKQEVRKSGERILKETEYDLSKKENTINLSNSPSTGIIKDVPTRIIQLNREVFSEVEENCNLNVFPSSFGNTIQFVKRNLVPVAIKSKDGRQEDEELENEELENENTFNSDSNNGNLNGQKAHDVSVHEATGTGSSTAFHLDCIECLSSENRSTPYSDLALIERVFQVHGDKLCKLLGSGEVLAFSSLKKLWTLQDDRQCPEIYEFIYEVINNVVYSQEFQEEFGISKGEFDLVKLQKNQNKLRSVKNCREIKYGIFQSSLVKERSFDAFDSEPRTLFCSNGLLDMASGEMREPTANDFLLKRSEVRFEPGASCKGWERFLEEVFASNPDPSGMVRYLQELFGYTLTGSIREQVVFCHFGSGANGKSTILGVLRELCGSYGDILGPDTLSKSNIDRFERIAARVKGLRCAIIDDVEITSHWNEAFIKNLTATYIESRFLYKEKQTLRNRSKFHLGLNEMPTPESNNEGIFRRIRIINYNRRFKTDARKSNEIEKMIERELSGILNWAITGLKRYIQQGGFNTPEECVLEQESYRENTTLTDEVLREMFEGNSNENELIPINELLQEVERIGNQINVPCHYNAITLGRKLNELFPGSRSRIRQSGSRPRAYALKLREEFRKKNNSIL